MKSVLNELKLIGFVFVAVSVGDAVNSARMNIRGFLYVSLTRLFSFKRIEKASPGTQDVNSQVDVPI